MKTSFLFSVWAVTTISAISVLMKPHLLTLPLEFSPPVLSDAKVIHFLSPDCGCSRLVAEHLIARKALPNEAELVYLVGRDASLESGLKAAGFDMVNITSDELTSKYALTGIPYLAVSDEYGNLIYGGGYSKRYPSRSSQIMDLKVLSAARAGDDIEPLPTFGCKISKSLTSNT